MHAAAGWLSENSMLAQLIGPRVTEAEPERYLRRCWRRIRYEGRGRHLVDDARRAKKFMFKIQYCDKKRRILT